MSQSYVDKFWQKDTKSNLQKLKLKQFAKNFKLKFQKNLLFVY